MLDNEKFLETVAAVFKKYDLPDGVTTITNGANRVEVYYRLGRFDAPEMEQIQRAVNEWKMTSGDQYVLSHSTEVAGTPVLIVAFIPQEAYVGD